MLQWSGAHVVLHRDRCSQTATLSSRLRGAGGRPFTPQNPLVRRNRDFPWPQGFECVNRRAGKGGDGGGARRDVGRGGGGAGVFGFGEHRSSNLGPGLPLSKGLSLGMMRVRRAFPVLFSAFLSAFFRVPPRPSLTLGARARSPSQRCRSHPTLARNAARACPGIITVQIRPFLPRAGHNARCYPYERT